MLSVPGRDILTLLTHEGKRKPHIQYLIDNIKTLSDADIENAVVPMKWYKEALKKLKAVGEYHELEKYLETVVIDGKSPDPIGTVREWVGQTTFITVNRGITEEVKEGTLIWFPETGGFWIDTTFANNIDHKLASTKFIGPATKSEYSTMVRNRRNGNTNFSEPVVEDKSLFRIQKIS